MSQTYDATLTLASNADDILDGLLARTDTLRTSQSGAIQPATPAAGWLWEDTTSATDGILNHYDGDAWVEVGSALHGDLSLGTDAAPKQLLYGRLENRTSHIAPGAAQIGRAYIFTTDSKGRIVVSATVRETIMSGSNVDYIRTPLPITADACDATNPPTLATKGTTPTLRGRLFSATNMLMSWMVKVPAGFSGDADLKLRLTCVLNQGETAGDDIDWTADVVSVTPAGSRVVSGTQTSYTVATDMPSNVAVGCVYECDVVLTYNDATNPIAAGDELTIEIHRTNLSTCGGVILTQATLLTPFGTKITE